MTKSWKTRYADDVVIVLKSKAAATRVMYSITDWIERKLGLKVNATKTKVTPPSKLKYLGFGFWKDKEEWKARPHNDSVQKLKRKLKQLCKRSLSIDLTYHKLLPQRLNENKASRHRRAFKNADKGDNLEAVESAEQEIMGIVKARSTKLDC